MIINDIDFNFDEVAKLDISSLTDKVSPQMQPFFFGEPGREIYRLLAYFSTKFEGSILTDIGTAYGDSALALSFNANNKINTFDIVEQITLKKDNVNFIKDDPINNKDLILSSPFLYVDTVHDGSYEYDLYNFLVEIGYKGYVLFDDIHLNANITYFFNSLEIEKYDLTAIGHWTGTGMIVFK